MNREQKAEQVEGLRTLFAEAGGVVLVHYSGLSVAELTQFRGRMRDSGAGLRVIKNRLAKIALEGTPSEAARDLFSGPTAIAFSPDPVAVSKAAVDIAKENENFILIGGILGASVLDEAGVKALATMPSLDELRAKLVGVLNQPAQQVVQVLNAPGSEFVRTLNAPAPKFVSTLNAYVQREQAA